MKRLLLFLLLASGTSAQTTYYHYENILLGSSGIPITNGQVYVCAGIVTVAQPPASPPCTPTMVFADINGNSIATQPLSTAPLGNYGFYAPVGAYTVALVYNNTVTGETVTVPNYPGVSLSGNNSFTGSNTFSNINNIYYVDGTVYQTLANAFAAASANPQGGFIFDTKAEIFSANPFSVCPPIGVNVKIFLGVNDGSNVPIVLNCSGVNIVGLSRSGSTGFYAGGSFPGSSTLFTVGNGASFIQGSLLQDLSLNCNNNTTCTPYNGNGIAENSGVDRVAFTNYYGIGALISSIWSTNFTFEHTVFAPSSAATAASGVKIDGISSDNNPILRITCPYNGAQQSGSCVDVENSAAHIEDIHPEGFTNGVLINNSHVVLVGYNAGAGASGTITDHIKITGTGSLIASDISACGPNYGTNLINNLVTTFTLPVATTCLLTSYKSGAATEGEIYFYPGIGSVGEKHTGDITAVNYLGAGLQLNAIAFASLGTPPNGTVYYCNDCTIANPCASGGNGAIAKRLNGAWVCN